MLKLAVSKICEETPSKFKCLSVSVDGRNMMIFFFFCEHDDLDFNIQKIVTYSANDNQCV